MPERACELSLVIVSLPAAVDRAGLLAEIQAGLSSLGLASEVLVPDHGLDEAARRLLQHAGCILVPAPSAEYGARLRAALQRSSGRYILTMDGDPAPPPGFLRDLWNARGSAEIVIGSRYVPEGEARMPALRRAMSRLLNFVFSRGLDLRVRDMSCAFRLYNGPIVRGLATECRDFDVLQEILVKALMEGYRIREVPLRYRSPDPAYGRAVRFGWAYARTFGRLWKLRNSILSADYDARAYNALMPPQRYWQRQRYRIITSLLRENGNAACLDVGCGSSRIIGALPGGSLALDILLRKLRFARQFGHPGVQGSIFHLPVPRGAFPCVLCSQVIEHVPRAGVLDELDRVLQPGGFLILGTPDYANWEWRLIEWLYKILLPQAYADEHITHYTRAELVEEFVAKRGYTLEATRYILRGELILGLRKP